MNQTCIKLFLLLTISFLCFNCEKENRFEEEQLEISKNQAHLNPFNVTTLESSEIQANTKLTNKLNKLNEKWNPSNIYAKNGKDKYSVKYDLKVHTNLCKYIESTDGNYHSYTFTVTRPNNKGNVENLVVSLEPNGSYSLVLLNYDWTKGDYESIRQGHVGEISGKITSTLIEDEELTDILFGKERTPIDYDYTNNICVELIYEYCIYGNEDHMGGREENGSRCPGYSSENVLGSGGGCTGGSTPSGGDDGNSTGESGDSTTGYGGTGGGNNTGSTPSNNPVTIPILAWESVEWCMNSGLGEDYLSADTLTWLQDQDEFDIVPISIFLNENNCNDAAKEFTKLAIDALIGREIESFEEAKIIFEANFAPNTDDTEKIDPNEELKCFDLTKRAKLTVYVQQPEENTAEIYTLQNGPGHAFIGIEQGNIRRQLGFYPESSSNEAFVGIGIDHDSELRNNYNYLYHISISKNITSSQLTKITEYIKKFPNTYNVNKYACADFAIEIGNLGDMNLSSTTVSKLTYKGRSPGKLGQEIRAMNSDANKTISKIKSNSPNKQGDCN
ncbi:hypothetical protein [uncultured Algibacter sp.]|uniref:hypothetical protein n=1 Tax=uncultured Algibacter sp. TaxID=298659 RepID=UPI0026399199|nr:hypothetical protein [uncultured Algibacter sp.]